MTSIATHIFHAFSAYFAPARIGGHLHDSEEVVPHVSGYTLMAIHPRG